MSEMQGRKCARLKAGWRGQRPGLVFRLGLFPRFSPEGLAPWNLLPSEQSRMFGHLTKMAGWTAGWAGSQEREGLVVAQREPGVCNALCLVSNPSSASYCNGHF